MKRTTNSQASEHPMKRIKAQNQKGFTLTESITTVAIIGTLSAIALPNYINQTRKSSQSETVAVISQIMSQAATYNDEFGEPAQSWKDLDKIGTIKTASSSATRNDLNWITLQPGRFKLMATQADNKYTFTATPVENNSDNQIDMAKNPYNIFACINVATGSSDIKYGNGEKSASASDLTCN